MKSIQTRKVKKINNETLIVTIDIGKIKNFNAEDFPRTKSAEDSTRAK